MARLLHADSLASIMTIPNLGKKMKIISTVILCFLMSFTDSASAGALYRWHMTESSPTVFKAGGILELSGFDGSPNIIDEHCHDDPCSWANPSSSIRRFQFWTNDSGRGQGTNINFITGDGIEIWDPKVIISFSTTGRRIYDFSIELWTFDTNMLMEGGKLIYLSSDWAGCAMHCEGSSGYFQQVPEPGTLALFGFGAMALALGQRRRKRQSTPFIFVRRIG